MNTNAEVIDGSKFVVAGLTVIAGGRRVRTESGRTRSIDSIFPCGHIRCDTTGICGYCAKPLSVLTEAQEDEYSRYISEGIGDTDGYFAPIGRETYFRVRLA